MNYINEFINSISLSFESSVNLFILIVIIISLVAFLCDAIDSLLRFDRSKKSEE